MAFLKTVLISIGLSIILLSSAPKKNFVSYTINGIVLNKETGNPIPGVYLYAVKGEEEALTNNKGAFQLVTWQKLPATLHLHYKEDEQVRVVVTKTDQPVTIKL